MEQSSYLLFYVLFSLIVFVHCIFNVYAIYFVKMCMQATKGNDINQQELFNVNF